LKERGGFATTIALLLAALLGVSYIPRKAAETAAIGGAQGGGAGATSSSANAKAGASSDGPSSSCEQIANRLRRIYAPINENGNKDTTGAEDKDNSTTSGGVPMPDSCFESGNPRPSTTDDFAIEPRIEPSFVVAIVPNPVQTHLALTFDRLIEAIQQAAQDVNFNYDNSWFPWNQSGKSYDSLSDEEQAAQLVALQQQQPGILVFRRSAADSDHPDVYRSGLVIFVVGEQPTGGISDAQFEHALQWISTLKSKTKPPLAPPPPLRIIGPTFSGTLASIERELKANNLFAKYPNGIEIYSGTTNAAENVVAFQKFLCHQDPNSNSGNCESGTYQGPYRFRTFLESDSLMTDRFLCYLRHEGYNLNHVAILSEDQTAFGGATNPRGKGSGFHRCYGEPTNDSNPQQPIYVYYPRDIATLRSAYEKQSIFSAGKQQNNAPSSELRGNLSEPASVEHDTVRTYGGQLTPLAQEAALFGIANILDRKEIEFVILRSSNSLDQLFLSEFLRRSYPNGRVVIDGADLMFRRGMEGASLRGVMLLSTYPLLSWTQDAIPPIHRPPGSGATSKTSFRVFPQDLAEGIYIASRELLEQLPDVNWSIPISDYGVLYRGQSDDASPENHRPATWLSVVGHRQFWAIAILNDNAERNHRKFGPIGAVSASLLTPEARTSTDASGSTNSSAGNSSERQVWVYDLPGEMTAALLVCVAISLWHLYCCWNGSIIKSPRVRAYFAPIAHEQHAILIFIGSFVLGLLGIIVGMVFIVSDGAMSWQLQTAVFLACGLIVVLPVLGCWKNYHLATVFGDTDPKIRHCIAQNKLKLFWALVASLVVTAVLFFAFLPYHLNLANRIPTFWRSLNLRSGVSPLLPQMLLLTGFYAWFWHTLHGLALFGDDRPVLPSVVELPRFPASLNTGRNAPAENVHLVKMFWMFSREGAGDNVERNAMPLSRSYLKTLLILVVVTVFALWIALDGFSLRNLGDRRYGALIFFAVAVSVALVAAETLQLLNTWSQLRQLLIYLDRLRIRRTLCTLRNLYGGSIWKLSGNVLEERYRLISRQFESMGNLRNLLQKWVDSDGKDDKRAVIALRKVNDCATQGQTFASWYVKLLEDNEHPTSSVDSTDATRLHQRSTAVDIKEIARFQRALASTAGCVMRNVILPAWQADTESLLCVPGSKDTPADSSKTASLPEHVRAAEEFFLLPYMGFIQNTLGRIRTIALSIVSLFVAVTLAVSSYPFDPLPVIGAVFLVLFVLVGAIVIFTYAEMCRDATLSHVANTTPGELGWDFWVKMIGLGAGPFLGLLTTLFPSMTDFIVSVLQPGAEAIK